MTIQRHTDEVARLGDEIYERDIRHQVEAEHHGEYIAIDVDHGCWGIGANLRDARAMLDQQRPDPDSRNVYGLRVGFAALRHFGGRPLSDRSLPSRQ
ncbi:MAG: hypothetical protein OXG42_09720 [Chloroflexi bacterium]|nr:hypothetical protein [Chloroflexota bacterium]